MIRLPLILETLANEKRGLNELRIKQKRFVWRNLAFDLAVENAGPNTSQT